jgi:hypothetical protein
VQAIERKLPGGSTVGVRQAVRSVRSLGRLVSTHFGRAGW